MGEIRSTLAESPVPVQGYILRDAANFPRGSVRDTSSTCHSPLQHGLMQAAHNTLGLESWSTVCYLFRDRPVACQDPGYPPPADVPGSHSSLGSSDLREQRLYACEQPMLKPWVFFQVSIPYRITPQYAFIVTRARARLARSSSSIRSDGRR